MRAGEKMFKKNPSEELLLKVALKGGYLETESLFFLVFLDWFQDVEQGLVFFTTFGTDLQVVVDDRHYRVRLHVGALGFNVLVQPVVEFFAVVHSPHA